MYGSNDVRSGASSLRRLRNVAVPVVLVFAALVIVTGVYSLAQQFGVALENATRTARNTVTAVEAHALQTFDETFKVAQGIADVYNLARDGADSPWGRVADEAYFHRLLKEKLEAAPAVATFFVVDGNYKGVAGSHTYPVEVPRAYISSAGLDAAIAIGRNFLVGRVYRETRPAAPVTLWSIPLGVEIRDAGGMLRGYVFAMLNARYFADYYATFDVGANGRVVLSTTDGRLVAAAPHDAAGVGAFDESLLRRQPAPIYATFTDQITAMASEPIRQVVAGGNLGELPFAVSVTVDAQEFLLSWRQSRNAISIGMIGIIVSMAVFAFITFRQLTHIVDNERNLSQAKAAAEDANEAKNRFLANMSHEFRTPLNAIMGFSEIIKDKVLGSDISAIYTSYADHIHRSGSHLLNIVNDILDMAKIESGAQALDYEAVDIAQVVTAAASLIEGMANQKGVRLRITTPPRLPAVTGDQRLVRQVFINLLSNAVKFSPPDDQVGVTAHHHPGGFLDISISDNGPGIEPAVLRRVGEPFLQGTPSVSHAGQGTGLGLSICKRYMSLLGGELIINSNVGAGTTATIRFPERLLGAPIGETTPDLFSA